MILFLNFVSFICYLWSIDNNKQNRIPVLCTFSMSRGGLKYKQKTMYSILLTNHYCKMLSNEINKDPECLWDDSETWIKQYSWETPSHQTENPFHKSRFGRFWSPKLFSCRFNMFFKNHNFCLYFPASPKDRPELSGDNIKYLISAELSFSMTFQLYHPC